VNRLSLDQRVTLAIGAVLLVGLGVFAWAVPSATPWSMIEALAGVGAALVALGWLVPGRWTAWLWGLGSAAFLVLESAWEYEALPGESFPYQAGVWAFTAVVLMFAGARSQGGWQTGVRAGIAGQLVASVGWALLLGIYYHNPLQTAVLESEGALARFSQSSAVSFWAWVVDDFWGGVLLRLAAGAALGAGAGALGAWVRRKVPMGRISSGS
jgi:hypothetical protein